jgi:hypothetical protein
VDGTQLQVSGVRIITFFLSHKIHSVSIRTVIQTLHSSSSPQVPYCQVHRIAAAAGLISPSQTTSTSSASVDNQTPTYFSSWWHQGRTPV